ncbi:MAG: hypothetical protein H0T46_33205 [Deltaproteobacteria bacterium]|nr:hypothetical protein [Deltaproteobacteria bacterium]
MRGWPILIIAGVAVVALAVMFREEIWDATGHDPGAQLVYSFKGKGSPDQLAQARRLIEERIAEVPGPATVSIDGDRIVIEVEHAHDVLWIESKIGSDMVVVPRVDLHSLDYDPEYLKDMRARLRGNKRAKELGVEIKLDRLGYHVTAPSRGEYVNTAWAEKHGCSTRDRLTGTGVYCTVSGPDRIQAFLIGDAELFVEPLAEMQLAADRSLVVHDDGKVTRGYVIERSPIVIESAMIASAVAEEDRLILTLTQAGIDTIAARVLAPTVQLIHLVGNEPRETKILPGGKLSIASPRADARRFVNSHGFASLPALHELPDSP